MTRINYINLHVSGSVHREGLATRGTASMPEALFGTVALPLMCDAMTSADLTDEMNYGTEN